MFDVLRLHARHALEAWRSLRTEEEVRVASDNTAFLPAALEVLETPPNPLGRLILWAILGFLALALAWSILGTVDVVSVGEGKIVPRGQVKVIQAADTGVVRDQNTL